MGLLLCLGLVALSGAATQTEDADCKLDRDGQLIVGTAGQVSEPGLSEAWEQIPEGCQGAPFILSGSSPADDFDVRFYDEAGDGLAEHRNELGDEQGSIPAAASQARISYWSGAVGSYGLEAGPHLALEEEEDPAPINTSQKLYLKSGPTGIGNLDRPLAGAIEQIPSLGVEGQAQGALPEAVGVHRGPVLEASEPRNPVPSVSAIEWDDVDSPVNTVWTWAPDEGFAFEEASVTFSFWEAASGDRPWPATSRTLYDARLYVDGVTAAHVHERSPGLAPGQEVTIDLGELDLTGGTMRLTLESHYAHPGLPTAIAYDAPSVASHLSIQVPS